MIKRFLIIIFLIFNLPNLSIADDIQDFQIEGISIGDSLLDYINYNKIESLQKNYAPSSKKYIRYYAVKAVNTYESIDVYVLDNDNKFIIKSLSGTDEYINNIEDCYPKKKKIVKSIESQLNIKGESYISNYDNNTSNSDVTDFILTGGSSRVWCTDYSEKKEERGYVDHLSVTVSSNQFLDWIDNEAYK